MKYYCDLCGRESDKKDSECGSIVGSLTGVPGETPPVIVVCLGFFKEKRPK